MCNVLGMNVGDHSVSTFVDHCLAPEHFIQIAGHQRGVSDRRVA